MVQQMNGAKLTNSISCNYIVQMIPPQSGKGFEMSCNILPVHHADTAQEIALSIIKEQTKASKPWNHPEPLSDVL